MNYKTLGKTGIQVSNLCFGTMSFGGIADEAESLKMYQQSREAGINFYDCANVYNGGRAEEILGKCIKDHRNEVVLTSKVFGAMGQGVNDRGLSRRHMTLALEESLRRLGTDRIELYFVHSFDSLTSIEEILKTMDDLQRQGKILYPAVSNWAAWQISKALGISAREGLSRFECIQPMYNLVKRQVEVEILPLALSEQVGVISYSPLGGGLLTGKYSSNQKPATGRLIEQKNYTKRYAEAQYYETTNRFISYAAEHNIHPATLAVAWVMANPAITAPIIGARSVEQLEPSLAAREVEMTQQTYKEITSLSITPPLATDRLEEQS